MFCCVQTASNYPSSAAYLEFESLESFPAPLALGDLLSRGEVHPMPGLKEMSRQPTAACIQLAKPRAFNLLCNNR